MPIARMTDAAPWRALAISDDEQRVRRAARQLTDELWQYKAEATAGGWVRRRPRDTVWEGSHRSQDLRGGRRVHLSNRPGFPAGAGCALHLLARRQGRHHVETKPDVCWQLPIRRQFRTVTRSDETTYTEVTIGEYTREAWGPGGHDLDWYCSGNPDAHHGRIPVRVPQQPRRAGRTDGQARTRSWPGCALTSRPGPAH